MASVVATALLLALLMVGSVAAGPEADALLAFRAMLRGPQNGPPAQLDGWGTSSGSCSWVGVKCDDTGRVLLLQLEHLALQGPAPDLSVLAPLSGLRSLSLTNNNLTGAFPDLSALAGLKTLYFSGNRLAGRILDGAFAAVQGLDKLLLSENNFTGPIPSSITLLPRLRELQLSRNGFEGALPDFGQKDLLLVDFSYNDLSGPIPVGLRRFGANAFQGNIGLCGPPLSVSCPPARTLAPPYSLPAAP